MALTKNSKICPVCHATYASKRKSQIYCSHQCQGRARRTCREKACDRCGLTFLAKPSEIEKGKAKYCSKVCYNAGSRISDPIAHFWSQVTCSAPVECWPWVGRYDKGGYGKTRYLQKTFRAHRLAYLLNYGDIPQGMMVLHSCHNRPCCNPRHLRVADHRTNMRDMVEAGRSSRGEKQSKAKLTTEKVLQIRILCQKGMKQCDVAHKFNISKHTVWDILHEKTWKYVV